MKQLKKIARFLFITISASLISSFVLTNLIIYYPEFLRLPSIKNQYASVKTSNNGYDPVQIIESVAKQTLESSNKALQTIQWSTTAFIISLLGVATTVATTIWNALREETNKINEISNKYELVSRELEKTHREFDVLTNKYLNLQQDFIATESQTLPFDFASKAFENGRISKEKYVESQAWYSWQKWIFGGDETGYKELQVYKNSPSSLPKSIKRSALATLVDLEEKLRFGAATLNDQKNHTKLRKLLNLPEN